MSHHRRTSTARSRRRTLLLLCAMLAAPALRTPPADPALPALDAPFVLHGQHAAFRVKGRVVTERGEPIDKAVVRAEAFFGYAAGTFAGPRKYEAECDRKG